MVIGLNQTVYEVSESELVTTVYVEVLSGILQREVIVNASIIEDMALGSQIFVYTYQTIVRHDHVTYSRE